MCKTHTPPNTAFRGFGAPQGMLTCEHILEHLASAMRVSSHDLRMANLYAGGDEVPFGEVCASHARCVPHPTLGRPRERRVRVPRGPTLASTRVVVGELTWRDLRACVQILEPDEWRVPRAMAELRADAQVDARLEAVANFNASHRWRKRGLAFVPTKYGVNVRTRLSNDRGCALLAARGSTDGSCALCVCVCV